MRMRNVECRTNSNASDVRLPDRTDIATVYVYNYIYVYKLQEKDNLISRST